MITAAGKGINRVIDCHAAVRAASRSGGVIRRHVSRVTSQEYGVAFHFRNVVAQCEDIRIVFANLVSVTDRIAIITVNCARIAKGTGVVAGHCQTGTDGNAVVAADRIAVAQGNAVSTAYCFTGYIFTIHFAGFITNRNTARTGFGYRCPRAQCNGAFCPCFGLFAERDGIVPIRYGFVADGGGVSSGCLGPGIIQCFVCAPGCSGICYFIFFIGDFSLFLS